MHFSVEKTLGYCIAEVLITQTATLFKIIKSTIGLRVSAAEEREGLDLAEHGSPGYGPHD